jgi:hypothetical protein
LTEYDKLLEEVRIKAEAFRSTAREYIPKMYWALRNENPNLTPEDARDRIEKDCVDIWSKRTILDALPDEAKDLKKQKAGRLSQKEANSAAVSAAPLSTKKKKKEEFMIDTEGKPIENSTPPIPSAPLNTTTLMSTIDIPSPPYDNNNGNLLQNNDDNIVGFEFSLPLEDVVKYIYLGPDKDGDQFWINGTLDKRTLVVISAAIGRILQLE